MLDEKLEKQIDAPTPMSTECPEEESICIGFDEDENADGFCSVERVPTASSMGVPQLTDSVKISCTSSIRRRRLDLERRSLVADYLEKYDFQGVNLPRPARSMSSFLRKETIFPIHRAAQLGASPASILHQPTSGGTCTLLVFLAQGIIAWFVS